MAMHTFCTNPRSNSCVLDLLAAWMTILFGRMIYRIRIFVHTNICDYSAGGIIDLLQNLCFNGIDGITLQTGIYVCIFCLE